ncbi:hypothetical protein AAGS40_21710 [Paraburkholderia sp. PREW-6R]|uniref:hypothetical protein n=1 Tax=Paraburkholderia sp. PREW-6R TaxID=3141544 RepID=UPI0031F52FA1
MSYHDLDREIAHLELVFRQISTSDRIPLSYWRGRLRMLSCHSLMPAQRARIERLEAQLHALEEREETLHARPRTRAQQAAPR